MCWCTLWVCWFWCALYSSIATRGQIIPQKPKRLQVAGLNYLGEAFSVFQDLAKCNNCWAKIQRNVMATGIGNQVIFGIQNLWIPGGKKAVLVCTICVIQVWAPCERWPKKRVGVWKNSHGCEISIDKLFACAFWAEGLGKRDNGSFFLTNRFCNW